MYVVAHVHEVSRESNGVFVAFNVVHQLLSKAEDSPLEYIGHAKASRPFQTDVIVRLTSKQYRGRSRSARRSQRPAWSSW